MNPADVTVCFANGRLRRIRRTTTEIQRKVNESQCSRRELNYDEAVHALPDSGVTNNGRYELCKTDKSSAKRIIV